MNERKSAILSAIINEHVTEGSTVASKSLVDKYEFSLSPATIRNEMVDLEKQGFIYQPHTSAGRIPTEKGWKYYIENFIKDIELTKSEKLALDSLLKQEGISSETAIKSVAKGLAEISKDAVFVGLGPDNYYYTGLSQLFRQPEFQKIDLVYHVSEVVEHLDEVVKKMFDEVPEGAKILVGEENPFGKECSSIVSGYTYNGKEKGLFGILGPMRMNYENNLALINYAKRLFAEA